MCPASQIYASIRANLLTAGILLLVCSPESIADSSEKYIPGQLFVKVKDEASASLLYSNADNAYPDRLQKIIQQYEVTDISKPFILDDPKLQKTYLVKFDRVSKVQGLINDLSALDFIEYAERVPGYEFFYTPNDMHPNQWYLGTVMAEQAWDISTGSASVVIAIVDDAVLLSHEDLAPVIWVNPGEIPGNFIDDDGNGYIDDINGWDAADNDNDPNPLNPTNSYFTHGTHVAGIAGAKTDNNIGIASVSFNISLMAVKIGADANSLLDGAYQGVAYAIAADADIISMSWGGGAFSQTYQNLFDLAYNNGIVLIAAAGNSNTTIPMYPASYNYVISVGATNSSDQKASFSNYGATIDVMAPGQSIWSSLAGSNSSYNYLSGASMACPLVSSLAALMLSRDPSLTPDELEACLKSTCDNIDAQNPSYIGQIGAGRINAYQALLCLKPISAEFSSDYTQVCPGDTVQFTDLSTNNPFSWQWSFSGGTPSSSTQQDPAIVYSTPGIYDVTLIATNVDGTDTITKTNYITVAVPTATISGSATIPAGFSANLRVDLTGNPNWSITYFDGTSNFTIDNITNTPYYISIFPTDTTTYTLISVNDAGCGGAVSGNAVINVFPDTTNVTGCITTFQKILGGSTADWGSSVVQTADGGYIFTGGTSSFGAGLSDVYLVKTDANGDTMWTRSYGGAGSETGHDIQQTADGGYIIAGESIGLGAGNADCYLIRTDINGNLLWSKTYGGADYDRSYAVDQTTDGGFILTGRTSSFGAGLDDMYLIKTDMNGDTMWTKTYGGTGDEVGKSVRQTSDGGYIITGWTGSYGGSGQIYLVKTDSTGNVTWTKVYGGFFMEEGRSVQQTSDGGYILTGFTVTYGAGSYDVILIKTDSSGNMLWSKTYGGTNGDWGKTVQQTTDGGYIITGYTAFGAGGFGSDVYLIKTDSIGDTLWTRTFGGTNADRGNYVQQTSDGGYIIAGESQSFITGNIDMYLIKTDGNGNSGCNQFSANTLVNTVFPLISSGVTVNNPATIVNNVATIMGNTSSNDSVLCAVPCPIADPQIPCITTFEKTFGGDSTDCAYALLQTSDSGYVWVGTTNSFGAGGFDIYMVKTDVNGDTLWTQAYGGAMNEYGYAVQQTADSGYIVAGLTNSFGAGDEEAYLLKTDQNGSVTWMKTYGGPAPDRGTSVQQTTDGGYILGGSTESYGAGSTAFYLIKTDSGGDTLWTKTYGGNNSDLAHSLQQTTDNGYIIAGYTYGSFGAGSRDYYVIKTDSIGDTLWTKTYGGTASDVANFILQTMDGGYIIVGHTLSFGAGGQDIFVVKTNGSGDTLWTRVYGGTGNEDGFSVKQLPDGGYIIVGNTESFGAGMKDVYLIRIDLNGDTLWTKTYGGVMDDGGFTVQSASDGGFVIGGCTQSFGLGGDCYIIKTDSSGNSACNQSSTGTVVGSTSTQLFSGAVIGSGATVTTAAVIENGTATTSITACFVSCDSSYYPNICAIIPDFSADTVCIGDSTTFNDQTTDSISNIIIWRWYFGDGDSLIGVQHPKHLYSAAGSFLVKLIVGNDSTPACFATIVKQVLVVDTLFVKAPPDDTICTGDSILLAPLTLICGSAPFTYNWTPGSSLSDSTIANPNAGPQSTTTYYITVTDSAGMASTDSVTIYIDTGCCRSWALIGSDTNYCFGDTVYFSNNSVANGSATYYWDFGPSATPASFIGASPPPVYFNTTGAVQVMLILSDSCGIDTAYHTVNIFPAPIADAGADTALCRSDTVQIGSIPVSDHSYAWYPATGLSDSNIANPYTYVDSSLTYIVVITDMVSGCTNADSITITLYPATDADAGIDTSQCLGDSVQLNATGGIIYNWTPAGGLSDDSIADPWVIVIDTITYVVTVTDSNTCTGMDSVTIRAKPLPNADAGSDTSCCAGDSVQLSASGGIAFTWAPANTLSDSTIQNPWAGSLDTTMYFVTVEDSSGCSNTDSVLVSVIPLPAITATADTVICPGAVITLSAMSNGSYLWSTGDTTKSINVAPTGDSLYMVSTGNTCGSVADSVWVLVNPLPFADAGQDVTILLGNSTQLSGLPSGNGLSYSWTPIIGLSCANCQNPLADPENTTTYYLTVTDSLGCSATDSVMITVDKTIALFIPDIFSPNSDGENDYFYIQGIGIDKLNLVIYDRWGEKIFENNNFKANDPYMGWDGTYKGKDMNPAVFVFVVTGTFIDGSEISEKGDFTLVR